MAPVFDVHGVDNRNLARSDEKAPLLTGDFDGDGHAEAVMRLKGIGFDTYRIYGENGFRMKTLELIDKDHCPMVGDLDGDGRDEFINYEALTIVSYNLKGKRTEYEGWPSGVLPSACHDLDGDGRDEIIGISCGYSWLQEMDPAKLPPDLSTSFLNEALAADKDRRELLTPRGGYLNVQTGKWTELQLPELNYRGNFFAGLGDEVTAVNLDGGSARQIVLRPWVGSFIMAFDLAGKLRYYEEFGEGVLDHGTVQRKGKDYVVVQTEKRLLIYP